MFAGRRWKVILEDLQSQCRVFGEGMSGMREELAGIRFHLTQVEKDVSFIKMALPTVAAKDDLKALEKRLTALETSR